jgi:hypothetical protein
LNGFYKLDEKFLLRRTNWVLNKAACALSLKGSSAWQWTEGAYVLRYDFLFKFVV